MNWYENECCVDCRNTQGFREVREKDLSALVDVFIQNGHFCDDCEITV
ncbi:MAG: hypothetical protein H5T49_04065 [Hadesarchaea archaeon]|nr:hypothetical protein [Hadesarchaea archaeon]